MTVERERYVRPLADTATCVEEVDEACGHLCAALAHANGEMAEMIREDIEKLLARRFELSPVVRTETSPGGPERR